MIRWSGAKRPIIVVNNNSALNQEIRLNDVAYGGTQRGRADLLRVGERDPLACVDEARTIYERLPGRVFVRGFLRNYAKLLGVDRTAYGGARQCAQGAA